MVRWKKLAAAAVAFAITATGSAEIFGGGLEQVRADNCGGLLEEDVYTPDPDEVIQDPILHWAVRSAMNAVKSGVKLTAEMVGDKSVETISYELCNHPEDFADWKLPYWIESLEGLQYATSARMIDICYTSNIEGKKIDSAEPLAALEQLEILYLKQNGLTDISPLKSLVNLQDLDISGNHNIKDISAVEGMKDLNKLNISINSVQDISPAAGLTKLERFYASDNGISNLPDMTGMKGLKILNLSDNNLTDVAQLGELTGLEELNLSGNNGITDITALGSLVNLEKDSTYMPTTAMKNDLFASIDVTKLFSVFNISKMTKTDLENVQKAMDAYEALSDAQKAYIDKDMVEAAKSNKALVEKGEEPKYYPEYDKGGEPVPALDRITIRAVDKHDKPMEGVEFVRMDEYGVSNTKKTDANGAVSWTHSMWDRWGTFLVKPEGDIYVSEPEKIIYTVNENQETGEIDGKPATGLEELVFRLIPADEYVDKSELEKAVKEAGTIDAAESYKYTKSTWDAYEKALKTAKESLANGDASEEEVKTAADALNKAYKALKKTDILTKLKIVVKDENGNPFTRDFKIQIRNPKDYAEAWNAFSDGETGVAYLNSSKAWADGKVWEVLACYEEPYEFTPFKVTIGERDGEKYYKTVDGKKVDADYERKITLIPEEKDTAIIGPDNSVLLSRIEAADVYEEADYTPGTWNALEKAIKSAEKIADDKKSTQEDYNEAAAALLKAEEGLRKNANKSELKKEIDEVYTDTIYTPGSWVKYEEAKSAAEKVYDDPEATQEEVDKAIADLVQTKKDLVVKADKEKLETAIAQAEAVKEADYTAESYEALQVALEEAKKVYDDAEASQDAIDEQVKKLNAAMDALEKKPEESGGVTCTSNIFQASVKDENGKPVSGVKFQAIYDDGSEPFEIESEDGVIQYFVSQADWGKITTISLIPEQGYTTEDEHYFTVKGMQWFPSFDTIDGQPYKEGISLTYTLKKEGASSEEVLSDETAFRAKVVDADGKPVEGVKFDAVGQFDMEYELVSDKDGILEHVIAPYIDFDLTFEISIQEGQESPSGEPWLCEDTHTYVTSGNGATKPAYIETIDGKPLAEAGEIVFHLTTEGGEKPEADKTALEEKMKEAEAIKADGYTAESYETLRAALEEAKKVYADAEASQKAVDEQVKKLNAAMDALEKESEDPTEENKEKIEMWLGMAETYPESDYTAESYKTLKEAMEEAQTLLKKDKVTEEETQNICDKIDTAIAGLEKADKPVYCTKTEIRIKVTDENGNLAQNGISFAFDRGAAGTYNAATYDGELSYLLNTQDAGTETITVSLKGGSIELDGKTYVVEPKQFVFGLKYVDPGVEIAAIDGKAFTGEEELIFVLKEKTEEPEADRSALESLVAEAEGLIEKEESYTLNSFQKFEAALSDAEAVLANEEATQDQIDDAAAKLQEAKDGLKTVQGMRTLVISVQMADGSTVPANTEFVRRDTKYGVNHRIFAGGDGTLVWKPGSYDEGEYTFYLPEDSAYIATPEVITVQVGKEDGTTVIESVSASVFTLSGKETEACDLTHFRAVVQDSMGNVLPGVQFSVANGDPAELTSDENGVITYEATIWDTDTTMTIRLKEGQGWICDQTAEFSVIADQEDPKRAILGTINGAPFQGGEKIIFQLQKEGEVVVDWTALTDAMDQAGKLDKDRYTEESYGAVEEALQNAEAVYANENATQEEVDAAANALLAVIEALEEKPTEPVDPDKPVDPEDPEEPTGQDYKVVSGEGQEVSGDKSAAFRVNADIEKFQKVLVDGKEISAENYVVSEGSTVVVLKKDYIATLKEGTHTISIVFTDGTAEAEFAIVKASGGEPGGDNKPSDDNKPSGGTSSSDGRPSGQKPAAGGQTGTQQLTAARTGDTNMPGLWLALGIASLGAVTGGSVWRARRRNVK